METDLSGVREVPSALITSITFSVSTDEEKEKFSALEIDAVSEVNDSKLGLPNPSAQCSTCGSRDIKSCEGHFGVIKFPMTILNQYFMSEVVQILNKVCPGCKSIRRDLLVKESTSKEKRRKVCKYCFGTATGYPPMKFKISSKEIFHRTAIIAEVNERLPMNFETKGFKRKLAADYWDIIPKDEQQEENTLKPNRRILSHAQVRHLLEGIDLDFIKGSILNPELIFINYFPVTPNCHRVTEVTHAFANGQRLVFDDRTRAYKKLVDFRGIANELSFRVLDCLKTSKLNPDKSNPNDPVIALQKKSNDYTVGSSGLRWTKDIVLAKRNDHCFRMVVVGDPNLKLTEIGIPCHVAERLQISEHLTAWNWEKLTTGCEVRLLEKGEIHIRREGNLVRARHTKELRIGDVIYRPLSDGDIVLINRPPSIHQHSLIALSVKVLPVTSALAINPLCCPPFRGDFDGDCLHGYVPQSVDTRVELSELIALDKQLINTQSGRNLLSFSQDSLVAAHLVMEDGVFLNLPQIQQLEMFCHHLKLLPPAVAKAPLHNGSVWTGKQLISMLLPPGFNHVSPTNDVHIYDGELITSEGSFWLRDTEDNLFQSLVKNHKSNFLEFLHSAQEVLCEWLSMRGLSVSLSDLYVCPDSYSRKNMMSEISYGLQDADQTCTFKQLMVEALQDYLSQGGEEYECTLDFDVDRLCYEKQRSAALSQGSVDAFKQVFRDIQSLVYRYASNDNSLMAMIKSGSKGNLLKFVQHSMCLGLQHSLVPLSFRMPRELTPAAWNELKTKDAVQSAKSYVPCAVVEGSFLTGLNPLECFVHSVTSRDSSFSDNADLPGTLTRRLMFFLRDIYTAYDGTVRNAYGNQLIQFCYENNEDKSTQTNSTSKLVDNCDEMVGQPVGSLAACALSEAAYSALDQPISLLEKSPLLNLKNILECGLKKSNAHPTATLFLSEKLGRHFHGFEYGALEVKNHLERLLFSDIVSFARIIFSPKSGSKTRFNPWVCHFHVFKEIIRKKGLKVDSIINALYKHCKSKINHPDVQITTRDCSLADTQKEKEETFCITVTIEESSKNSSIPLEMVQDLMIPFLLQTVIKGLMEVKKVEILWNERSKILKSRHHSYGELYLKVYMSAKSAKTRLWNVLMDGCLPIMDMIDWTRSHPDNIRNFCSAYGIDAGWKFFLNHLDSAISDVGKTILPQHLLLVANTLSITGEFVGLNAKGLKQQREHASVLSPFMQACFSNPGNCFIKAAKAGIKDDLQGCLDGLAWGQIPCIGTGQFDIMYAGKDYQLSKPADIYNLLGGEISSNKQNAMFEVPDTWNYDLDKVGPQYMIKLEAKISSILKRQISYDDVLRISRTLSKILNKYPINHNLSATDKEIIMSLLQHHPHRHEKIGVGAQAIKVVNHPKYEGTRCFSVVRIDGTVEDFSYRKCVHHCLLRIAPQKAKRYHERYLQNHTM